MLLPDIDVIVLHDGSDQQQQQGPYPHRSLREYCSGKVGVIDLWHTKCTQCPAALTRFNSSAAKLQRMTDVLFIACALSLGDGNEELVAEIALDSWESLHHLFIETEHKDAAKAAFGYSAVPYYVLFDRTGRMVKCGDSKAFDYLSELTALLAAEAVLPTDENAPLKANVIETPLHQQAAISGVPSSVIKAESLQVPAAAAASEHVFVLDADF